MVASEHRSDDTPFVFAEFIPHASKLRFWKLWDHVYVDALEDLIRTSGVGLILLNNSRRVLLSLIPRSSHQRDGQCKADNEDDAVIPCRRDRQHIIQ